MVEAVIYVLLEFHIIIPIVILIIITNNTTRIYVTIIIRISTKLDTRIFYININVIAVANISIIIVVISIIIVLIGNLTNVNKLFTFLNWKFIVIVLG